LDPKERQGHGAREDGPGALEPKFLWMEGLLNLKLIECRGQYDILLTNAEYRCMCGKHLNLGLM
jgi:hypothetical protein